MARTAGTDGLARSGAGVRSAEVFAALSLATDHGTGQVLEHGLRTCLIAVALTEAAGIDGDELEDIYYLGLLHSIGCTADAPEAALLFGDDLAPRAAYTLINPGRPVEMVGYLWRNVHPQAAVPHSLHERASASNQAPLARSIASVAARGGPHPFKAQSRRAQPAGPTRTRPAETRLRDFAGRLGNHALWGGSRYRRGAGLQLTRAISAR